MRSARGFTLLEMVMFILILSILSTSFFVVYQQIFIGAVYPGDVAIASARANARMDLILGQKRAVGFNAFSDPCTRKSPDPVCDSLQSTAEISETPTGKLITVTGFGDNNSVSVPLITEVDNY